MTTRTSVPIALLDTNVKLDIYSWHDLTRSVDAARIRCGEAGLKDPDVEFRRIRARDSLLLAIYFNRYRAATLSLREEPFTILEKMAPKDAPVGTSRETEFVRQYAHFTKDYLLPEWEPQVPPVAETETGTAADRLLVDLANQRSLPLITNEGFSAAGLDDVGLRKRARNAGARVFSPREFFDGKLAEQGESDAFLKRFRTQAPNIWRREYE